MNESAQKISHDRAQTIAVLTGASIMLTMSMGMRQSFGLFVTPITQDVGVSVSDFTFALAVQNIVWGMTQPFTGAIADRFGCRTITVLGSLLFTAGLIVTMLATGSVTLLIGMGLMIGLAMSCVSLSLALAATARVVSPAKRSLTLGAVSAAGSLGSFVAAPLAQGLIVSYSWQIAIVGFLALCAVMIPAAFFTGVNDKGVPRPLPGAMDRHAGQSLKAALSEAGRHRGYVTMAIAFFVCGLQLVFITTHLPAYLALCGQSPQLSATALAVIGGFNAIGCYLLGWLGGKFPKQYLLGGVYIMRSLFIIVYFSSPATPTSTVIFAAAMGLLWLGTAPLVSGLIAQIFGLGYMATLSGVAFFSHQLGSFIGAWGGGLIFDAMGSYDLAWQIGVAIGVSAGIAQLFMDDRPTPRMATAAA
ncbi:MAG: MFS transporter [Betaproteobacteria bacterium RBG_16_64_9]|nr:MAG: MFS transporter [Betaproteobacteria bacterium RBG_16_64_9]OGA35161.1 MAG: MFS transporter [Betaproteobacteria bacterium RIFCSPLOWO2_12_FULL_62_13b]